MYEVRRDTRIIQITSMVPSPATAAPSYTGPGDVVAGLINFWGLRAATAALIGNALINVQDMTTSGTQDIHSGADGLLDTNELATFLGAHVGRVTTVYDQIGGKNQIMGLSSITRAALITTNVLNGLPSMQFDNNADIFYASSSTLTIAQPFTVCLITRTDIASGVGFHWGPETDTNIYICYRIVTPGFLFMDASSEFSVIASTGTFYNIQTVFNGASSQMVVGGTSTGTVTVSGTGISADTVRLGGNGTGSIINGYINETGIWDSAFDATKLTNMKSNQDTYMANA